MGENAHGESIDVRERGGDRDGIPQVSERRLFMQLMVFEADKKLAPADSLRNFVSIDDFSSLLRRAGYGKVDARGYLFGGIALHRAAKNPVA